MEQVTSIAPISTAILRWFENRGISEGNLRDAGVYSGQRQPTGDGKFEIIPSISGKTIVFPFWYDGQVVNEKYRDSGKKFYQRPGGKKVFYGAEVLDDPMLLDGRAALIIVEGECDRLAVREAGNPFVVSVPDGAPPAFGKPFDESDFDPEHDTKYSYIYGDWDRIKKIKRVIIATDNDAPGRRLAEELVRRLGRQRCSFVEWPDGSKDFNDVLMKHGPAVVAGMIDGAKHYPVSGIYRLSDLPVEPMFSPVTTGFRRLDEYLMVYYPSFMVVTGFAGSGKSSLVNQAVAQMSIHHGWRIAIASFEMRINPFITDTLKSTYMEMYKHSNGVEEWMEDKFVFITPEPTEEDSSFDIDWLIERAITAVIRYGIRVLVIDPWNEIEHAVGRGESLTEYTGRAIRSLKRFGREFECMVIVVAHPAKSAKDKKPEDLSLYDVSDSAHFANKSDLGVIVTRLEGCVSSISVKKVRYQPQAGKPGSITLSFDSQMRIFGQ